jgi:hypothetical protein
MALTVHDLYVTVEGPKKKEVVDLTLTGVTFGNYVSSLQNPEFATFVGTNANRIGAIVLADRDVTVFTSDFNTSGVLTVYGF